MTGRGIDQILPHPSDPTLHESYVKDARRYVALAREVSGPIRTPVDFAYPWGDAIGELERLAPHLRIANLETAVTTSSDYAREKGIHYRMHPDNVACLEAAGLDCCTLANNHVLDWGTAGLEETLQSLHGAGIRTAGAGRDLEEASSPAILESTSGTRVLVYGFGLRTSGIPSSWAASPTSPGLAILDGEPAELEEIAERVSGARRPGDLAVCSVHWGSNWGYGVPEAQRRLAHELIEVAGFDVVHGHSSHHPKGIEIRRGRPILYGCGDLLTDYEGIQGHQRYRGELGLMYLVSLDRASLRLASLRMVPTRMRRLRVNHASPEESRWLAATLDRESRRFGSGVDLNADGLLALHPAG